MIDWVSTKICMVKCVHGGKSERRIVLEISNYFVLLFKIKLGRKCIKSKGKVNGSEDIESDRLREQQYEEKYTRTLEN